MYSQSYDHASPIQHSRLPSVFRFLALDAFVRTNRRAIAMMFVRLFVRLSVYLSVRLGRACIVIIRCTLARI